MPANKKPPAAAAAARPAAEDKDGASFEESLERLETIVEELEAGSLTLDQSLARYEEGMRLSRRLSSTLDQAEKRIERLVEEEGQAPTTRAMERDPGEREGAANDRPSDRLSDREGDPDGGEGELPF